MLLAFTTAVHSASNEPFIFEVKSEIKTIGDIKPAFIVYQDKPLPKVSVNYVLKRYIKLFETANSPAVKIDALNRVNTLREKYGLKGKKLSIDKVKQSEVVLDSYNRIVDTGVFYQRMDELLYQTAKATKFIGNDEESIKRLKLLVGLYPRSELVDESKFRMAEAYFDLKEFAKAEAQYKKLLAFSVDDSFHQQSKFKLGWTVFRQDRYIEAGEHATSVLDDFPSLKHAINYEGLELGDQDLVDDTFRLLSLLFSKEDGAESIEALQGKIGHNDYAYLLYDSLFRFYLQQDRFQDASVVAHSYTTQYPVDFNAYQMAQNEIQSYKRGEFDIQEWEAKEHFAENFGTSSQYWSELDDEQYNVVQPLVVATLKELSHLYFVRMQTAYKKSKRSKKDDKTKQVVNKESSYHAFGLQAANYYLDLVKARGKNRYNGESLFLAAEAFYKVGKYQLAIDNYERSAYEQAGHANAVNAGYAAVLAYQMMSPDSAAQETHKLARRSSIERFAKYFPVAKHTPALLNDLANELFNEGAFEYAASASETVVKSRSTDKKILYSSWLVNAHSNFELDRFDKAEIAYTQLLPLAKPEELEPLSERLAASVYKQAEQEQVVSKSAELYLRVVDLVPDSSIVPQALFDASSQFLQVQHWSQAIATLNVFQSRFPEHEMNGNASDKLIFAYLENGEPLSAAEKLVQVSNDVKDPAKASNSLYRAAEIYQENSFENEAVGLFESFTKRYPKLFELNIEAYHNNVAYYQKNTNHSATLKWQKALIAYEKKNESERNARSAYLAANASLAVIDIDIQKFNTLKLTLPLDKSLERKTKSLKPIVSKLEDLSDFEVAEVMSASTYHIARLYSSLASDLMSSERPKKLSELELEQYDILLEEEAYSFEETAMEIFQINLAKVPDGEFDQWINLTYQVLAEMNPTEFKRQPKAIMHAEKIY
jgi:TolA-binding protein